MNRKGILGLTLVGALGLAGCGPVKEPVQETYLNRQDVKAHINGYELILSDHCNGTKNRWVEGENTPALPSDGVVDMIFDLRGGIRVLEFHDPSCPEAAEWAKQYRTTTEPMPTHIQASASKAMNTIRDLEYEVALLDYKADQARRANK